MKTNASLIFRISLLCMLLIIAAEPGEAIQVEARGSKTNVNAPGPMARFVSAQSEAGGADWAVAVDPAGQYVYFGVGARLAVGDVHTNPGNVNSLAYSSVLPDFISAIALSGSYAYLADKRGGLMIMDVSNPALPRRVGSYPSGDSSVGVVVEGNLVFLADSNAGLRIIDVTDKTHPTSISNAVGFNANAVAVNGSYAYVSVYNSGLFAFDISNPASLSTPYIFSNYPLINSLTISGNLAYLADNAGYLRIVDISQPAAITIKGSVGITGSPLRVVVAGNKAYVACYWGGGIQSVSIGNPSVPTLDAASYPGDGLDVAAAGLFVYSAMEPGDMAILSIPNLQKTGGSPPYLTGAMSSTFYQQTAYVFDYISNNLVILDMSDPTKPVWTNSYNVGVNLNDMSVANVGASQVFVFAVSAADKSLHAIDVTDPNHVDHSKDYTLDLQDGLNHLVVRGTTAYVIGLKALYMVNVSNPSNMSLKGQVNLPANGSGRGIDVVSWGLFPHFTTMAYIAADSAGLCQVDVTVPASPGGLTCLNLTGAAISVAVLFGNGLFVPPTYAYVGTTEGINLNWLNAVQLTGAGSPVVTKVLTLNDEPKDLVVDQRYAYVANNGMGIRLIDIKDRSAPVELGYFVTAGLALDISRTAGGDLYVSATNSGLYVLRPDQFIYLPQVMK